MYIIGFLAQAFFSARILFQWILSEKAKKVVSPSIFWIFSILGSYLLFIYGWMRDDFSILIGQLISYYIYIWNLNQKGDWNKINILIKSILLFTPIVALAFVSVHIGDFIHQFFKNQDIPLWLIIFGIIGQLTFTYRFVYQIIYSVKRNESLLPEGFWILSITGSSMIIAYGIFRHDPVLIIGQAFGFVAYFRNIMIARNQIKLSVNEIQ